MDQVLMLQEMCNRHGDFKVAIADGDFWSRHLSVMECWEKGDNNFLARVNNRQILPCEIVMDIDEGDIEEKVNGICSYLSQFSNIRYQVWKSGGKGMHIHMILPRWQDSNFLHKEVVRRRLIKMFGCDPAKISQNVMIQLEGAPHRKTGVLKSLVKERGVWNV